MFWLVLVVRVRTTRKVIKTVATFIFNTDQVHVNNGKTNQIAAILFAI